jgi:hypothetical protein
MATGLGTPNAAALATGLCADALHINSPGAQRSTAGQPVKVQITTSAPAGAKLNFSASGLPAGLSISRSGGRITGKPKGLGTYSVSVSATDGSVPMRGVTFTWRVVGAPTVSGLSLTHVGSGHPRLALSVTAGRDAPQLASVTIGLPRGLRFGSPGRRVAVKGSSGKRVAFRTRVVRGRLQIMLTRPAQRVRITIGGSTISESSGLLAKARRHRTGSVTVSVQTTDASHHAISSSARIRPRF